MRTFSGIYVIKSLIDTRLYIGSAVRINYRFSQHLHDLRKNKHHSKKLQRFYNKYGENSLLFEVLEKVEDKNYLITREQYYIDTYKPYFNSCKIAGNCLGKLHSEETKLKISNSKRGQAVTQVTKLKLSEAAKGIKRSKETKAKMSKAKRGKSFSTEHKRNLGKSVVQIYNNTIIYVWPTLTEAAIALNLKVSAICNVLNGRAKSSGGFNWKYQ